MKIPIIKIYNEDCFRTMSSIPNGKIDIILTSPFYNTNKKAGNSRTLQNTKVKNGQYYVRYDSHIDSMSNDEYCTYTKKLFLEFGRILIENGVVLYNLSYGSENTEGMFMAVNEIISKTEFTIADVIIWKKSNAFPNSCSKNKLTRITEFVFIFCRKNEIKTFKSNKKITSFRKNGQPAYENIYNFIEAKNNDGSCPYNKATFSSDLCKKLLKIYANNITTVYDPFMGSGTTAIACIDIGVNFIGSEISKDQCEWANTRVLSHMKNRGMME